MCDSATRIDGILHRCTVEGEHIYHGCNHESWDEAGVLI